jgi:lysyl-tRNA synthetase class I
MSTVRAELSERDLLEFYRSQLSNEEDHKMNAEEEAFFYKHMKEDALIRKYSFQEGYSVMIFSNSMGKLAIDGELA